MLGVILCGGQSTRMGSDKGLLKTENEIWAKVAFDKLTQLDIAVAVSINKNQLKEYGTFFSAAQLITDNELLQIKGPLAAVLSVHLQNPSEDLLVLACDMLLMEFAVIDELHKYYKQHNFFDAFVFTINNEPEPLCSIYTAKGLALIFKMYNNLQLLKHSMKFMLEQINVCKIAVADEKKICFRNFNAHAELNGL
jgi:molybdopterin-guanine dinucleotide biosynthesis protein A